MAKSRLEVVNVQKLKKNSVSQWESQQLNNMTYNMYYSRLKNIAINNFEWINLPDTVNERFFELTLFEYGHALFFYDELLGYMALPANLIGMNVYNEPTSYMAFSTNYNKTYTTENAQIVWNNYMHEPSSYIIQAYAQRLYEVERTIDVNIKGQKTPILILADEQQRLTLKNLYMQYDGNEPFIFGNKSLDMSQFSVLKTDAPFVADKLLNYKHALWNECMTYLGLSNSNTDKKERLVEAEATSNIEQIEASRQVMLNARQEACEKINKMFGLNISVQFRVKEVMESGEVYNTDPDDTGIRTQDI